MKRALLCLLLSVSIASAAGFAATPRTMRVDYYHTGDVSREIFSLDEVVLEPLPWPGSPDRRIDDTSIPNRDAVAAR